MTLAPMFGNHPKVTAPWPRGGLSRHWPTYDRATIERLLAEPADLIEDLLGKLIAQAAGFHASQ